MHLPLGTYVKVTNMKNDMWVIVRVNDRGPVPAGRIIDLSYGAAQMLKMRAAGVQKVRLDIVEPDTMAAAGAPTAPGEMASLR
jgi:rare lipoprotein A